MLREEAKSVSSDNEEFITISLKNSTEKIPLSKVQRILIAYENDIYDYNRKLESKRLGKVLTIIDGAIADQTQRKAIKDIVNDMWYGDRWVDGHSHYPQLRQATDAIGFPLRSEKDVISLPAHEEFNRYKEV